MKTVVILGSGPQVLESRTWKRDGIHSIVAINNAHAVRDDWDFHIFPWDFPMDRQPPVRPGQRQITQTDFVPAQNRFGGFVYAGGTMAFTAAYWVLDTFGPCRIAFFGCDMHYPSTGSHFYGTGSADPLRADITLRSLEAKSARFQIIAALNGSQAVNLSSGPSRLTFPRAPGPAGPWPRSPETDLRLAEQALDEEARLNYFVPSGRYWEHADSFSLEQIDRLDDLWLQAAGQSPMRGLIAQQS